MEIEVFEYDEMKIPSEYSFEDWVVNGFDWCLFSICIFTHELDSDNNKELWVCKTSTYYQTQVLTFSAFMVAHLGVFAFLFQVFNNPNGVMQVCLLFQLCLLIFSFIIYGTLILRDKIYIPMYCRHIKRELAKDGNNVNGIVLAMTNRCEDLSDKVMWDRRESKAERKMMLSIQVTFVLSLILCEVLTIVYIYQNI